MLDKNVFLRYCFRHAYVIIQTLHISLLYTALSRQRHHPQIIDFSYLLPVHFRIIVIPITAITRHKHIQTV